MSIFTATFESVATLLFIGFVGFYVISRKVLPENALHILIVLTIDIALPAMVFAKIITTFRPEDMPDWWKLPVYFVLFSAFALVLAKVLTVLLRSRSSNEFFASLFFQNGVFFPIAIISGGGFDDRLLVDLFLFTLFFASLYFSSIGFFFTGRNQTSDKIKIFNPILIATILGVGFVLIGLDKFIPDFVASGFELVGDMSIPLLMLILGGSMYLDFREKGKPDVVEITKFVLAKNFIFPAVLIAIIAAWKPSYELAFILLLQAAVPPITSLSVMAVRYNGNRKVINQFILSSFLLSLISIPLFMMILDKIYS